MIEISCMKEFSTIINSESKLIIVDFWAPWCSNCRFLSPVIDDIENENSDIVVVKVNIETQDNLEVAKAYSVSTLPTLLFFKNGKLTETSVGLKTKQTLLQIVERNK